MLTAVQVEEWLTHPVTEALRKELEDRQDWLDGQRAECFVPGNPEQTQENHLELNGRRIEVGEVIEHLTDRETFEYVEEFSGESKRDLPDGVQAIGEGGHY